MLTKSLYPFKLRQSNGIRMWAVSHGDESTHSILFMHASVEREKTRLWTLGSTNPAYLAPSKRLITGLAVFNSMPNVDNVHGIYIQCDGQKLVSWPNCEIFTIDDPCDVPLCYINDYHIRFSGSIMHFPEFLRNHKE